MSDLGIVHELAAEIKDTDGRTPLFRRKGVVQTVQTGAGVYTCTIRLGGSAVDIPGVPCLNSYVPKVGDIIEVIRDGPQLLIVGKIGSEYWHEIGGPGEPAFQNGWVNLGGEWDTAGYFKDAFGIVHLKGLVKSGVVGEGTHVFTLPIGFRLPASQLFITFNDNGQSRLNVKPDGGVSWSGGAGNAYSSLSGVSFRT
jgi:hypothetical protein